MKCPLCDDLTATLPLLVEPDDCPACLGTHDVTALLLLLRFDDARTGVEKANLRIHDAKTWLDDPGSYSAAPSAKDVRAMREYQAASRESDLASETLQRMLWTVRRYARELEQT